MTYGVDPTRRTAAAPLSRAGETAVPASAAGVAGLPAPVAPAPRVHRFDRRQGDTAFLAHLLGQPGQARGLRGGAGLIDAARKVYTAIEWSGAKDRRARKGRRARTEA